MIVNYFLDLGVLHSTSGICYNNYMNTLSPSVVEKYHAFEENVATGFGFGAADTRISQLLAESGMVAGIDGTSTAQDELITRRNKDKREKLAAYGFASITGETLANDLDRLIDEGLDELREDLETNLNQQEVVRTEIAEADRDVEVAQDEVHVAQMQLFREADRLSMISLEESEMPERWEHVGTIEEAMALLAEEERLQQERLEAERAAAEAETRLAERRERLASRLERRAELRENLATLENDETNIRGRMQEYESFRERMRNDPELQASIRDGSVTIDQLRDAGAPTDLLERLEGQELNRHSLHKEMRAGFEGIITDTRTALDREGKSYASNYDDNGIRLEDAAPLSEQFLAAATDQIDRIKSWWNTPSTEVEQPQVQVAAATPPSGPNGMT